MATDPNSFESLRPRLSARTLKDIEGLDPAKFGFERGECCGPIPEKLAGSMNMDKQHVFLVTPMPANEWGKRTENVPGFAALHTNVAVKMKSTDLTVSELPAGQHDGYVLRFRLSDGGRLQVTQYHCSEEGAIPWLTKGTLAVDRSEDTFIFICAHRSRDERCGYCGHVLADLFTQAIQKLMPREDASRVTVMLCSHIGGHIYAGNVIVYSKHGGVGFGLFKPVDVEPLVAALAEGKGSIPPFLQQRIRGQMANVGVTASSPACELM